MDKDTMVAVTPEMPECDLCSDRKVIQDGIGLRAYPETAPCPKCQDGSWAYRALIARIQSEGRTGAGEAAVEIMARAMFVFQHQGDIADPAQVWDAPENGFHPVYWVQKMEHNHPHYRAMAKAGLAALSQSTAGEDGA